jgi:flagellin
VNLLFKQQTIQNDRDDRANLQLEVNALTAEIDRIADTTSWAGKKLLTGSGNVGATNTGTFQFQVGSDSVTNNSSVTIDAAINAMTAAALGVGAGNSSVGANAAKMNEVGENVLQITGTPVANDVYKFDLNGTSYALKLVADGNAFDYALSSDGGSSYATTVTSGHSQSNGVTVGAVADHIAHALNALTDHPGLTATANSDGSVLITQGLDFSGTAADPTGNTTSSKAGSGTVTDDAAGTVSTASATINGTAYAAGTVVTLDSTNMADSTPDKFFVVINGTEKAFTLSASDSYADNATGWAARIKAELNADTNFKGFSFDTDVDSGNVRIAVTQNAANLISSESVVAANTSTAVDVTTSTGIDAAIVAIDAAIKSTNNQRASLGSVSNRLDSTVSNLTNISSNLQAGRGRIEDADFAAETTSLAKSQILQQASTAMLAQANASKQNVLSLLQG